MASPSNVKITIALQEPDLNAEELQKETETLLQQLRELNEVENANFISDPNPPNKSKSLFASLIGLLTVEVNAQNIKGLMGFLGDRLYNKSIELEVEANGKKLKVKASSQQELTAALKTAQEFVGSV